MTEQLTFDDLHPREEQTPHARLGLLEQEELRHQGLAGIQVRSMVDVAVVGEWL